MAVPAATPETTPPNALMLATEDGPQLHVPPATVLLNVSVLPAHNGPFPIIATGVDAIVTTIDADPQLFV
jgi:hypothetical protein